MKSQKSSHILNTMSSKKISGPITEKTDDMEEEATSLSTSTGTTKTLDSLEDLVVRMKFARETALLTMPTWQSVAHQYAQSVLKIFDQIISVLTRSSDHLTVGSVGSDGNIQARLTPIVYFAGLLISNLQPEASEVNGTIKRMDVLFVGVENKTIKLIKTLKKWEAGIAYFTKSLVDELSDQTYRSIENDEDNENKAEPLVDRSMFQKSTLENITGVWLELINLERVHLFLQCSDVNQNGRLTRIPVEDLQLEAAVKLGSLLLTEIQKAVYEASVELAKIELTPEILKEWKKATVEFSSYLKLIRKAHEFSSYNCATDLSKALIEVSWKMNVVIFNRLRVLNAVCVWILKGIECVRRKTSNWAPDHEVKTTPRVNKCIATRRPVISQFLPCFISKFEESPVDYVKMFVDIGNVVGDSFLLGVAISETMKEILYANINSESTSSYLSITEVEGHVAGRSQDASNEYPAKHAVEGEAESEERIIIESEKFDTDIGGDDAAEALMTAKFDSADVRSQNHTPVSEPISRKDFPVELEMRAIAERRSDSEFLATDTEEKMTLTGAGYDDDGLSISSNPLQESVNENPEKSSVRWTPSEENREGEPSNSTISPNGSKKATTEEQSRPKFRFYWSRRLIEAKPK